MQSELAVPLYLGALVTALLGLLVLEVRQFRHDPAGGAFDMKGDGFVLALVFLAALATGMFVVHGLFGKGF